MDTDGSEGPEFLGTYRHALDGKGRVVLPATHRADLQEGVVMTIGAENCVSVFPRAEWQVYRASLRQLSRNDRRQRMYSRMISSNARADTLDAQGRVSVPTHLREYASLDRDIVVVGAQDHVELWNSARWEAYSAEGMTAVAETDEAFGIGIF